MFYKLQGLFSEATNGEADRKQVCLSQHRLHNQHRLPIFPRFHRPLAQPAASPCLGRGVSQSRACRAPFARVTRRQLSTIRRRDPADNPAQPERHWCACVSPVATYSVGKTWPAGAEVPAELGGRRRRAYPPTRLALYCPSDSFRSGNVIGHTSAVVPAASNYNTAYLPEGD